LAKKNAARRPLPPALRALSHFNEKFPLDIRL
jgi:hypothetical protein